METILRTRVAETERRKLVENHLKDAPAGHDPICEYWYHPDHTTNKWLVKITKPK